MKSIYRSLAIGFVFASMALVASSGCGSKNDTKTNPEFQVPDVSAGKREMPGGGKDGKSAPKS